MFVIKRIKPPPPEPMGALTGEAPAAVHWALSTGPQGDVTGWTPDRGQAKEFDEASAERTLAFYERRRAAGRITAEDAASGRPSGALALAGGPHPTEEDLRDAVAEIERLRGELRAAQSRLDAALAEAGRCRDEAAQLRRELEEARAASLAAQPLEGQGAETKKPRGQKS